MVSAELSVITYLPFPNSGAHWSIHLYVTDGQNNQHLIYQANGPKGSLELNIREADPRASSRFRNRIFVDTIENQGTIDEIKQVLEQQPMQNSIPTWSCQDWVREALEALNDNSLLDKYQYAEAKATLVGLYNN